jgi:hypothetical protein
MADSQRYLAFDSSSRPILANIIIIGTCGRDHYDGMMAGWKIGSI